MSEEPPKVNWYTYTLMMHKIFPREHISMMDYKLPTADDWTPLKYTFWQHLRFKVKDIINKLRHLRIVDIRDYEN